MENSETGGNPKEKTAPAEPPLWPISSFQVLQNPIYGDVSGTSYSPPPQTADENNKVECPPTGNAVSGAAFVFSSSKPAEQFQAEEADMDPKRIRRMLSNRRSAQRSREKKSTYVAYLETRAESLEDQLARIELLKASRGNQKEVILGQEKTLCEEIEFLKEEKLHRDAEIEKNSVENIGLRELQLTRKEQWQERLVDWNIGPQEPVSNYAFSNYYRNSYQGNGMGTSYIAPESSQMQIPAVPNMHETNLSLAHNMGPMDQTNLPWGTAPDPKP